MTALRQLWSDRLRFDMGAALAICAALALVPLFVSGPYALGIILVSIYFAIIALGWNLLAGYTGQFSLAPAAFAMIGGYTTALLGHYLHVPLALGIPAAIVSAALFGWVLGKLVLNLSGPYLSLTTLAFAEIARVVIGNSHEFTRGDQGMHVATLTQSRIGYYYIFLGTLVAVLVLLYGLLRGRLGRFMMAVLQQTGLVLSMVIIGGMSSLTGALLGAVLVYLSSEWLRGFGDVQIIVFALLVILFARYLPGGLWGLAARLLQRGRA